MLKRKHASRSSTQLVLILVVFVGFGAAAVWVASHSQPGKHAASIIIHRDEGMAADYSGLTVGQKLDRALQVPGIRGILEGVTGSRTTHSLEMQPGVPSVIVTDFRLTVLDFWGRASSPYTLSSVITLRVPGGSNAVLATVYEGAPTVRSGEHVFVFVRDQGKIGGGNAKSVLVVSDSTDVLELRDGSVIGQGVWSGYRESLAAFKKHFGG
jgi:hypothetical protein